MNEQYARLLEMVEEAEHLLIRGTSHRRSITEESDAQTKMAALKLLRAAKSQAMSEEITYSLERELKEFVNTFDSLPPQEREPAFKCVESYKACAAEASTLVEKALCGVALTICFAKEVIPLA
ncbi:MAG: hypothetical protein KZQ91_13105 [Candidatus Thiodiazotropha sp. (ex Lucinoma borealis)]|nr:hypothetical protein [Candidatus Thiodiazotropha sp. (ex Lucinoma borealis)]